MYKRMWLIRKFEEKINEYFSRGEIHGTCHLCIGEEATAVGSIFALKKSDYVHGTHRGHGQAIAFGTDVNSMMAEIFGKATGLCKGKGGSMHIADVEKRYLGSNGILGASMPISVGAALALKKKKCEDTVVLCLFGDGSSNQGAFHEAMNLAALWKLPLIFVCVNNLYGMSMSIDRSMSDPDLTKRSLPYGIRSISIDGNDIMGVYETVSEARSYVLGNGPMLIVENTYRHMGHAKMDANRYRTKEEINSWKQKDPIKRAGELLLKISAASEQDLVQYESDAAERIENAVRFALESPVLAIEKIADDVFAGEVVSDA
ncbi:MAG: thiamine pyrophosphate-dependent dehydrogenase E1 component subunit alpha [Anaerolineaceae bacterium]|nr:MAG: thiamine pyrophosphate-dependent dehydrogenase E1 component subunit alpha [Anaerolineaceae bacterium]